MGISTGRGDEGYTGTLRGERVPKHHLVIEASGSLDEAGSQLGVARAFAQEKRTKRILLHVQKQLFTVGAELSSSQGSGKRPGKTLSEADVTWLDRLIDNLEEALALPPGFVAFGQEPRSAHMNVARTEIRKAERAVARMNSEKLLENSAILKYLNRLSDLIFLLACFEERSHRERRKINRDLLRAHFLEPSVRRLAVMVGAALLALLAFIVFLLLFHGKTPEMPTGGAPGHEQQMHDMHR